MRSNLSLWLRGAAPHQLARWQRVRTKGRRHFILVYGFLVFGGTMWVLTTAYNVYFTRFLRDLMQQTSGPRSTFDPVAFLFQLLLPTTVISFGGGLLTATLLWFVVERQYRRNTLISPGQPKSLQ